MIVKRRFNFVDNITMKIDLVKQNEKPNGSELKGTDNVNIRHRNRSFDFKADCIRRKV